MSNLRLSKAQGKLSALRELLGVLTTDPVVHPQCTICKREVECETCGDGKRYKATEEKAVQAIKLQIKELEKYV